MPDLEISKLPALAGDNLQASDPIPLSDLSASETKKITVKDLVQAGISLIDDGSIPSDKVEGGTGQAGVDQIIAGDNITISPGTGIGSVTVNATATPYTLPTASAVVLGGVKVGNNLSISDSGVLSAIGGSGGASYKGLADFTGDEPNAVDGDFYINTTAGTGAWSGFVGDPVVVNQRAIYNGTDWDLLPAESSESYWLTVPSDFGTSEALRPVTPDNGLEVRGPYNYNPGLTASDFAIFEADSPNDRAKLEWRKDNASLSFEKEKDAPDGFSNPSVSVDIDGNLKLRDGIVTANPTRSSDWDSAGSVMIRTTNYSENTFAVNYMGDVDIRRSLSVGNIGNSGSRLPGVIKGISRNDEDSSTLGFSLEFGADKPFTADYAGNLYLAGQIEATGGIKFGDGTVQTTAGGGAGGAVTKIVAGNNVTLDPPSGVGEVTINATGGGTGAVESVNGETGAVVLDAADVGAVKIGDVNPTYFANQEAFPDASSSAVHGGVAHSHADGAMYFAHGGVWTQLANASDVGGGFWKEDGNAVTPKETGADLKIEGAITADGNIQSGGNAIIGAEDGVVLRSAGLIQASRAAGNTVWAGYPTGTDVPTSLIDSDGNGTFKGDVAIGESSSTFRDKAEVIAALTPEQRETLATAITAWNNRPEPYSPDDPSTLPADTPLREAIERATNAGKINLNGDDGSITAAGIFQIGGSPSDGQPGTKIFPSGTVRTRSPGTSSNDVLFEGFGGSDAEDKFRVEGNGKLFAAGNIQSGGNAITGAENGVVLRSDGFIQASRPAGNTLWAGYTTGNNNNTFTSKIDSDGTITAKTFDLEALDPLPA